MNNKKSGTYGIALLMSLFLCSIEMNAMDRIPHDWPDWLSEACTMDRRYNTRSLRQKNRTS
jgi:CYTH domain-containing protein